MNYFLVAVVPFMTLTACTLSFQNVDTHGTASDLIQDEQAATPTVTTDLDAKPPL